MLTSSTLRNLFRLGVGGIAYLHRGSFNTRKPFALISIDIFATILDRTADDDAAWREGTLETLSLIRAEGLRYTGDFLQLRRKIEASLTKSLVESGKDPEFSNRQVFESILQDIGSSDWRSQAADLARRELLYEAALSRPKPEVLDWLEAQSAAGARIVAASDTRYTADELKWLLAHHSVKGISRIYSSADHQANKFTGKLFSLIAEREQVKPSQMMHIGDNFINDCLSPSQLGIFAKHIAKSSPPLASHPMPIVKSHSADDNDPAFAIGYETFGPILVAFVRLLLKCSRRDGIETIAFIARDGDLPLDIARILVARNADSFPRLRYLHLSRRSVTQCSPELLLHFLRQEGILEPGVAFADIGWRGTIQKVIAPLLASNKFPLPRGYFLGLWDDGGMVAPLDPAEGLLCDQRRGRTLLESAGWLSAHLLESVCRASHGMVVNYREESDGRICPVHLETGSTRQAEQQADQTRKKIREGVLAYTRWFAANAPCMPRDDDELRRAAQRRLFRLVYFPDERERTIGKVLVHSEPTADDWASPLILSANGSIGGWIRGLRSPWMGGYLRETGGVFLPAAYCVAEQMLNWLPPGTKYALYRRIIGEPL